ncbi:MAG: ribosomal-processing cysteine protease Prp [Clostridia bacterium]|nr:ribosomal-processing cysteine protease Prp [Clostridia bacterium]
MTKIRFLKSDGVFYGFEEEGHAGFSEAGTDIICSAISAMTMLVINTIEVAVGSDVEYSIDEDTTNIKVLAKGALEKFESDEKKRFAVASVLMGYYLQLNDMLEDYYEFIDVEEEERPV